MTNKYCGDLRRRRIRATTAQTNVRILARESPYVSRLSARLPHNRAEDMQKSWITKSSLFYHYYCVSRLSVGVALGGSVQQNRKTFRCALSLRPFLTKTRHNLAVRGLCAYRALASLFVKLHIIAQTSMELHNCLQIQFHKNALNEYTLTSHQLNICKSITYIIRQTTNKQTYT